MAKHAYIPTDNEFNRVIAVVKTRKHSERNIAALMLSYKAGLRVGEIAQLKVSDIFNADLTVKPVLNLPASYTKANVARDVPISRSLAKCLSPLVDNHPDINNGTAPLILSQKKAHFSPNSLCQLFSRIYKDYAGIDSTSHSGRRWFITQLHNKSVSLKVIMNLAGHQAMTTTQKYIDTDPGQHAAAVELL